MSERQLAVWDVVSSYVDSVFRRIFNAKHFLDDSGAVTGIDLRLSPVIHNVDFLLSAVDILLCLFALLIGVGLRQSEM